MFNKIVVLFIAVLVLFGSQMSLMTKAVGVDTAVKIVAGSTSKQLVRGMAEEAGYKLSTRQLDNVIEYVNNESVKGNQRAIDFVDSVNKQVPSVEPSSKGAGWKKWVLDPLLWVSGLDLVFEAVDAFNDGYVNGTTVDVLDDEYGYINPENTSNPVYPNQVKFINSTGKVSVYTWSNGGSEPKINEFDELLYFNNPGDWSSYINGTFNTSGYNSGTHNVASNIDINSVERASFIQKTKSVTVDDYYDYSVNSPTISSTTITNYDNDTYYNQVKNDNSDIDTSNDVITYKMEIDTPEDTSDSKTNDMSTFWNVEDSTISGGTFYVFDSGGGDVTIGDGSGGTGDGSGTTINNTINNSMGLEAGEEITVPKNFFTSLTYMGEKVGEMYDGVTSFLSKAVQGMKDLTTGTVGFVAFIDDFFDWLPSEFKALLGVGFTLGVTSFFLRR